MPQHVHQLCDSLLARMSLADLPGPTAPTFFASSAHPTRYVLLYSSAVSVESMLEGYRSLVSTELLALIRMGQLCVTAALKSIWDNQCPRSGRWLQIRLPMTTDATQTRDESSVLSYPLRQEVLDLSWCSKLNEYRSWGVLSHGERRCVAGPVNISTPAEATTML